MHEPPLVFVSYAHEDDATLQALMRHLEPLQIMRSMVLWTDHVLLPSTRWEDEIRRALASAKVAIALVSRTFLGSSFVAQTELPAILRRAELGQVSPLFVALDPLVEGEAQRRGMARYQWVNSWDDAGAYYGLDHTSQEQILHRVAKSVAECLKLMPATAPSATRHPVPNPLPRPPHCFVDRADQYARLDGVLGGPDGQVVVIIGRGGHGKTSLLSKLLHEAAPGGVISRQRLAGILYLECSRSTNLGALFSRAGQIVGKADEFAETYASANLGIEDKLAFFLRELSTSGSIWIVLDSLEALLGPDDRFRDPELGALFREVLRSGSHRVSLVAASRAIPVLSAGSPIPAETVVDMNSPLPEDDAVYCLRQEGERLGLDLDQEEPAVLLAFVRRVGCIPKALESALGYLYDCGITLSTLMADPELLQDFDASDYERGLRSLVAAQFAVQTPEAQQVLTAVSAFPDLAPDRAVRAVVQLPKGEWLRLITRLRRNGLLTGVETPDMAYGLHPIVREVIYGQLPDGAAGAPAADATSSGPGWTRQELHTRLAEYFRGIETPLPACRTIDDLEPRLQAFHHLMRADRYAAAADLLDEPTDDCLAIWGYCSHLIERREQLVGKLSNPAQEQLNLGHLGGHYNTANRRAEALPVLQRALALATELGDIPHVIKWLTSLANTEDALGDSAAAIRTCRRALALAGELDDRCYQGRLIGNLGNYLPGSAMKVAHFETALRVARECGDVSRVNYWLGNLGGWGRRHRRLEYYRQATAAAKEVQDAYGVVFCLYYASGIWSDLGHHWAVLRCCTEAIEAATAIGEQRYLEGLELRAAAAREKVETLSTQAQAAAQEPQTPSRAANAMAALMALRASAGDLRQALDCAQEALALSSGDGAREVRATVLRQLAEVHWAWGEPARAISRAEEAMDLMSAGPTVANWQDVQDLLSVLEASHFALGHVAETTAHAQVLDMGQGLMVGPAGWREAMARVLRGAGSALEQARENLAEARRQGNAGAEASALNGAGWALRCLGETAEAIEHFQALLTLSREQLAGAVAEEWLSFALSNLGVAHLDRWEVLEAIRCQEEALRVTQRNQLRREEGEALAFLGNCYASLGRLDEARTECQRGLALAHETRNQQFLSEHTCYLGTVYSAEGDWPKAQDAFLEALALARQAGGVSGRRSEVLVLTNWAELYIAQARYAAAAELAELALATAEPLAEPPAVARARWVRACAAHHQGLLERARGDYEIAVRGPLPAWAPQVFLGLLCLEQGEARPGDTQLRDCVGLCQELLARTPELYDWRHGLALAHLALGEVDQALAEYRRALGTCGGRGVLTRAAQGLRLLEQACPQAAGLPEVRGLLAETEGACSGG